MYEHLALANAMRPKYKPTDTPPWINRAPAGINRELTLGVESKRGRWWCATTISCFGGGDGWGPGGRRGGQGGQQGGQQSGQRYKKKTQG